MQTRWRYFLLNRMGERPSFIIETLQGSDHRAYSLTLHTKKQIKLHDELKVSANEKNAIKFLVELSKLSAPYTSDAHHGLAELGAENPVLNTPLRLAGFDYHRTYTPEERGARMSDSDLSHYFITGSYKMTNKKGETVRYGVIKRGELTCFAIVTQQKSHRSCYETYFTEKEFELYSNTMSSTQSASQKLISIFKHLNLHYHPELAELSKNDRVLKKILQNAGVKNCKILTSQEIARQLQLSRSIDKGKEVKLPTLPAAQQQQRERAKAFQLAEGAIQKFDAYRRTVSSGTLKATEAELQREMQETTEEKKATERMEALLFREEADDLKHASTTVMNARNEIGLWGPHGIYAEQSRESLYDGDMLTQSQDRDHDKDREKPPVAPPRKPSADDDLDSSIPVLRGSPLNLAADNEDDIPMVPDSLTAEELEAFTGQQKSRNKPKEQGQSTSHIQSSLSLTVKQEQAGKSTKSAKRTEDDDSAAFLPPKRSLGCGDLTKLPEWIKLFVVNSSIQGSPATVSPAASDHSSKRSLNKKQGFGSRHA